jgi:hypothetical protein
VKKPVIIWVVQIYLVWFAIGAGMGSLFIVGVFNGNLTIAQGGGTFLVGTAYLAGAATLLVKISRRQISHRSIVLFLWLALASYPITNILRHVGLYLTKSSVSDDQLAGAAFAEILRYLMPIALILWLSLSKRPAEYLSASAGSNDSVQDDARNTRA